MELALVKKEEIDSKQIKCRILDSVEEQLLKLKEDRIKYFNLLQKTVNKINLLTTQKVELLVTNKSVIYLDEELR